MKILIRLIKVIMFPILLILTPVEIIIWVIIWIITGNFIEYPLCVAMFMGMDDYILK